MQFLYIRGMSGFWIFCIFIVAFVGLIMINLIHPFFIDPLTQQIGKPYRQLFNTSAFTSVCCCLFFITLIALDNYNLNYSKSIGKNKYVSIAGTCMAIFIPSMLLLIGLMTFSFFKLKFLTRDHEAQQSILLFGITFRVVAVLFAIICLIGTCFTLIFGFGNFDGIN